MYSQIFIAAYVLIGIFASLSRAADENSTSDVQFQLNQLAENYDQLNDRLTKAEQENQDLATRITNLEQYIATLENRLNMTDGYVTIIDERLYSTANQLSVYGNRINILKEATDNLDKMMSRTNRKVKAVDTRVSEVNDTLLDLQDVVMGIDDKVSYIIATLSKYDAFVATTHASDILVNKGGRLPFDRLLFQNGGGFDPVTHSFTCQHKGIYLFSTSIVNNFYWQKASAHIVKEGEAISASTHGDTYAREWNQGSVTTVTACREGQRVWVESTSKSRLHGGDSNNSYMQFMGVLLQPDL